MNNWSNSRTADCKCRANVTWVSVKYDIVMYHENTIVQEKSIVIWLYVSATLKHTDVFCIHIFIYSLCTLDAPLLNIRPYMYNPLPPYQSSRYALLLYSKYHLSLSILNKHMRLPSQLTLWSEKGWCMCRWWIFSLWWCLEFTIIVKHSAGYVGCDQIELRYLSHYMNEKHISWKSQ